MTTKPAKRKRERVLLRLELSEGRAGFFAADGFTASRLKARGFRPGDEVLAEITKARNPKFHRLVHQFGALLSENLDEFTGMDSHSLIKRVQLEAGICCEEMELRGEFGVYRHRIPQSLSFDSMDEAQFHEFYRDLCRFVASKYWPSLTPEQIEQMAGLVSEAA